MSAGGLDEIFDKSLGDFDEEMGREQAGVGGTGGAAERREDADEKSVRTASMRGGSAGGNGSVGGSGKSSPDGGSQQGAAGQSGGPESAGSSDIPAGGAESAGGSESDQEQVADLPDDISVDESAEDPVARQIREAAMAEKDPLIREALWDEYRKWMEMN